MPQPSFFPGNTLLLEKASVRTSAAQAKEIQSQVGSDLTTMKTFPFQSWRALIATRYASDPLVMELLQKFEDLHNKVLDVSEDSGKQFSEMADAVKELADSQEWTELFK
jgi:hypothetical protein